MTTTNRMFMSYAREDNNFVLKLAKDLRKAGIDVWVDYEQLEPGENWEQAIKRALAEAQGLLFVVSRTSVVSNSLKNELHQMIERSGTIIPIILDDTQLPFRLERYQSIDFRGDYKAGLDQLLSAVPTALKADVPVANIERKSKGYVFVSYAQEDAKFVTRLKKFLKSRGFGYWDYSESDRDYHGQLFLELEEHITNASALLSIVSPDWKKSEWAVREFFFAEEAKIPTFLLRVRNPGPTLAIAGRPYIDFLADRAEGFTKLGTELGRKGL